MPLHLRRKRLLLRYGIKAAANPTNPASNLTQLDWQATHAKRPFETGKGPLNAVLSEYLAGSNRTATARFHDEPVYYSFTMSSAQCANRGRLRILAECVRPASPAGASGFAE